MKPLKINPLAFETTVLKSDVPFLLVFGAIWDINSRMLFSQLERYGEKLNGKLKIGIADYDKVPDIFSKYEVSDIPSMIIFEDGIPVDRQKGYNGPADIDKFLHHFFGYLPYSYKF